VVQPANYAGEALLILIPLMNEEEIYEALHTITTQENNPAYEAVFGEVIAALKAHLPRARRP
jgi:hypothetical protein